MGPVSHDSVINFVTSIATQAGFIKSDSVGSKLDSLSGTANTDVVTVETPAHWDANCASSFRGICAVALLSKNSDEEKRVFESVAKEIGKSGAFRFVTIDAMCQRSFAEKFDVYEGNLPTVVAYSAAKNRYATFRGGFQLSAIKSFYESVLSGGTGTNALQGTPTLNDQQCDAAADASEYAAESVGTYHMDDHFHLYYFLYLIFPCLFC